MSEIKVYGLNIDRNLKKDEFSKLYQLLSQKKKKKLINTTFLRMLRDQY